MVFLQCGVLVVFGMVARMGVGKRQWYMDVYVLVTNGGSLALRSTALRVFVDCYNPQTFRRRTQAIHTQYHKKVVFFST